MAKPKGNSCLYYLFMIVNYTLLFVGFGTIAAGIFAASLLEQVDWYIISVISLGFLTTLVSTLGCQTRRSLALIWCYLFFTFIVFMAQLGFSLAIIHFKILEEKFVNVPKEIACYVMLSFVLVILACFAIGWCYRNSLFNATFKSDPVEKDRVPKLEELLMTENVREFKSSTQISERLIRRRIARANK